jgi:hypothetical protein
MGYRQGLFFSRAEVGGNAAMIINFPVPPGGPIGQWMQSCLDIIRRSLVSVVNKDEAVNRIILSDINNATWQVAITTTGVLTTTAISGKVREI